MTREVAIEKLKQTVGIYLLSGNADNTYCKEWREILEVLCQEPCEDAVSRSTAKTRVYLKYIGKPELCKEIFAILDELPSVQQKPIECEDAISREDAIHAFDYLIGLNRAQIQDILFRLPSVRPQEQTGHWVRKGQGIYCSECDKESGYNPFGASRFSDFCPSCGAKMIEPRGRSDKE